MKALVYRTRNLDGVQSNNTDPTIMHFSPYEPTDLSSFQTLLMFLKAKIYEQSLTRYANNWLCRRLYNEDGQFVHSYEVASDIKSFIYSAVDHYSEFDVWKMLTDRGGVPRDAVEYLQNCNCAELPVLIKDRYIQSFRNGLYFLKEDRFHAWGDGPLPNNTTACNYHPRAFDPHVGKIAVDFIGNADNTGPRVENTAWDIPTPWFDKILRDQAMPYNVVVWFYALFGRLFYWTGEFDAWQVWIFNHGLANTGKSTMCEVLQMVYAIEDTETLPNNIEPLFGLWPLFNKLAIFAPEVNKNFGIDRTDLQSMITGEAVTIKAKNQKAEKKRWRTPGLMSGNEIPAWSDTQGAMARRLVRFLYKNTIVMEGDLLIFLRAEIPNIILKCNRFYRAAITLVGRDSIWKHLPPYFHESRAELQAETSPIHAFMSGGDLTVCRHADGTLNRAVYIPVDELRNKFHDWKKANDIRAAGDSGKWAKDVYMKALKDLGLAEPARARLAYPRDSEHKQQRFVIYGLDMTTECERLDNILVPGEQPAQQGS
jgi:hypothetical protein